jgi:hypothetical protein
VVVRLVSVGSVKGRRQALVSRRKADGTVTSRRYVTRVFSQRFRIRTPAAHLFAQFPPARVSHPPKNVEPRSVLQTPRNNPEAVE